MTLPSPQQPITLSPTSRLVSPDQAHLEIVDPAAASNLPTPLTSLIGRDADVAAVRAILEADDPRLVTLTGLGGVGKTRLAVAAASEVAASFANGVVLVELAPVRDPALVTAAIAEAVGVQDLGLRPLGDSLVMALRGRELLLVLDNFEHVLPAAPLVTDLLVNCPRLRVLATSRAPLGLSGERLWSVAPLALPAVGETGGATSPAVTLFAERARAVVPDFQVSAGNLEAVIEVCRRLDGLPLAIELAAARTRVLQPSALLVRLHRRLPLLSGGPHDQPDRLRTMRDAIAWSYDLLSPAERAGFRRLAVFVGGCTVEGVEGVIGGGGGEGAVGLLSSSRSPSPPERSGTPSTPFNPSTAVVDILGNLIDQNLVQRVAGPDEPRFTMLETIREFGLEQLAASGEERAVRDAHAVWCIALAERAEPELAGPEQERWVRRLEADLGNIRAAHDWLAAQGDAGSSLRLVGAIGWFWSSAPYFEEARDRLDLILAMPGVERAPAALAKALATAGDVADW